MRVALFSSHKFEKDFLEKANQDKHQLVFLEARLTPLTVKLEQDCEAISVFVNDDGSQPILQELHRLGVRFLVLRSTGFNHVDFKTASSLHMRVARVQTYSAYAVAEHSIALMLALNRKLIKAHARIQQLNFSLDGLTGFDMHSKTVGIIGLGKIGKVVAQILRGFGCNVLAYDPAFDELFAQQHQVQTTDIDTLCAQSDIITLHVPLNEETKYLINAERIGSMKHGVMVINTSRGGLIHTKAVIQALKTGKIGSLGIDVYEEEQGLFFEDHSEDILQDDMIARLMAFQNVLITSHQAFLTDTALHEIAQTTIENLDCFASGEVCINELTYTS